MTYFKNFITYYNYTSNFVENLKKNLWKKLGKNCFPVFIFKMFVLFSNFTWVPKLLKTIFLKVDLTDLNKTQICRILPYFFSAAIIVIETVSLHFRQSITINFGVTRYNMSKLKLLFHRNMVNLCVSFLIFGNSLQKKYICTYVNLYIHKWYFTF